MFKIDDLRIKKSANYRTGDPVVNRDSSIQKVFIKNQIESIE